MVFKWFIYMYIVIYIYIYHLCVGVCVPCVQYIPRNMHTVLALLCFVVVIHWLIFPYPSGLLHWHCGNLTIAPVPAKQPWWIWINTSCEFIMNDCITATKQSTTKPCAYFLGYTLCSTVGSFRLDRLNVLCIPYGPTANWHPKTQNLSSAINLLSGPVLMQRHRLMFVIT